ncbi:MAG: FAD-dependent oxidoreductase [Acidobacteria bacterium 13_1_40CM_4_58_4]|nr:MAG: FAD-dependent oxidoreductase [Acidobacteria bacterium 13_1_40CM_4_58_4]
MKSTDFLIVGGGIIGLSIAREIKKRFGDALVTVLEKEAAVGLHASGRNSGVIHAGFYYSAGSVKAKLTRAGNQAMISYCDAKKIPLNRCGKLVVAQEEGDLLQLDELLRRGAANRVPLESLSEEEVRAIEPRAKTYQRAIFSPTTSSANPRRFIESMEQDALAEGVIILTRAPYVRKDKDIIVTAQGRFAAGHVVNAAGLYADKIALDFGFSERYRILPFKGLYLYSDEPPNSFRTHIYPVPDLRNPFLGVHFTVKEDGRAKIGPTAIPAFWREQYRRFDNFKFGEFVEVLFREAGLMISSPFDFKKLALEELKKYSRRHLVALASRLAHGVRSENYTRWGEAGIRAQLLDIKSRKLEMDFVIEGDENSTHLLNAVSPGWTCSIPFAGYVADRIEKSVMQSA